MSQKPDIAAGSRSRRFDLARQLGRDGRFWLSGLFLAVLLLVALLASVLWPKDPNSMNAASRSKGPGGAYVLGTDDFGRDILGRLIHGAPVSLFVSLSAVGIASVVGSVLGITAGYSGGRVELVIMRVVDAILSFPAILLALFVVIFVGTQIQNLIATIAVLYVPAFARIIHSVTLSAKQEQYVEAARVVGSPSARIIFRTILPNVIAPTIVQFSLSMGNAILLESSLSFLGLGPPPPAVTWGRMIAESRAFMSVNPYALIWPSLLVSLTVIAMNILGDAGRDALDPRLRGR